MECYFHNDIDAVGICKLCGVAVCFDCGTIKNNKLYCPKCLNIVEVEPQKEKEPKIAIANKVLDIKINELIKDFDNYVQISLGIFKSKWLNGVIHHTKVIKQIREAKSIKNLIEKDDFLRDVRDVVISFGMDSRSAKIKSFTDFKKAILDNKESIVSLSKYKLENLSLKELESLKEPLLHLFKNLKIMESNSRLVSFSKTMAHLIPDLIPPMDRRNINLFFYGDVNFPYGIEAESLRFWEMFRYFFYICREANLSTKNISFEGFNSSIPKLIDNAIWGYFSTHRSKNPTETNNKQYEQKPHPHEKQPSNITTIRKIHEAVKYLESSFAAKELIDTVMRIYPDTYLPTLRCHIYMSTVNNPVRVNWPINKRERISNPNYAYDLLFKNYSGILEIYVPKMHGIWEIKNLNGKFIVQKRD